MKHITGPAHIALMTADIDASIKFYEALGGETYDHGIVQKPKGQSKLAMVRIHGYDIELVQPVTGLEGVSPKGTWAHLAFVVDDLEAAIEEVRALGVDTFLTAQKTVLPELFGGLQNIFFTGPSGEEIELLQKL